MFLPKTRSAEWLYVFLIVFAINLGAIEISRWIIEVPFNLLILAGFGLLSLIIGVLMCLGFFGMKEFTFAFMVTDFIAIINMFYTSLSHGNEGWIDLTSIYMFLFIIASGLIISLLIQITVWITRYYNKENKVLKKKKLSKRNHKKS